MTFVQINKGNRRKKLTLFSHLHKNFTRVIFFLTTFIHGAVLLDVLCEFWVAVATVGRARS